MPMDKTCCMQFIQLMFKFIYPYFTYFDFISPKINCFYAFHNEHFGI